MLTHASVEGRLFHRSAVAELLQSDGVAAQLQSLTGKEFVRPDRALFNGDDGFRFNHILIRDAAYDSMPKQLRAELHERYAEWLEQRANGNIVEYEEFVGYHLERSYRLRAELGQVDEALALRAGRLLAHVGRRAAARGDARAATTLLRRAVDLLAFDAQARLDVLPDFGLALRGSGELLEAERMLGEAITEAANAGEERNEVRAEMQLAWVQLTLGRDGWPERTRRTAERAMAVFEHDHSELAHAWIGVGVVETLTGHEAAGVEAFLRAREHARAAGDDRREVEIWEELGGAMVASPNAGRWKSSRSWTKRRRGDARRGFRSWKADAALAGPYLYPMLGRFEEGRELLAKREVDLRGARREVQPGRGLLGRRATRTARRRLGRGGTRVARCAPDSRRDGDEAVFRVCPRSARARRVRTGPRDEAVELLGLAEQEGRAKTSGSYSSGELRKREGARRSWRNGEADRLARGAVEIVGATDNINAHAEALVDLAEVLQISGDEIAAAAALEEAIPLFEAKGNLLCAERARTTFESVGSKSRS